MKPFQIARIVLLLLAIFTAGIITGRLSAPSVPTTFSTAIGRQVTASGTLSRLTQELRLDKDQEAQIAPLLEAATERISQTQIGSPERSAIFRDCAAQVRALLRPAQHPDFDRLVRETEQRNRQLIRRNKAADQQP